MRFFRSPLTVVLLVVAAALYLLAIPHLANLAGSNSLSHPLFNYQLFAWAVALPVLVYSVLVHRQEALKYLRLNVLAGPMAPVRWLLIKDGEDWGRQGWQFTLALTLVTAAVISQQIPVKNLSAEKLLAALPFAMALALSNSLVEEIIFRHSVVTAFENHELKRFAPLASGVIFGCAHYFGAPGGFLGVLMAGFLGWLLAKSMQETGGIFWAWAIHACLDMVIFSAMLMAGSP